MFLNLFSALILIFAIALRSSEAASKCWGFAGIGPNGENLAEQMLCEPEDDACLVSSCNGIVYRDCFNTKVDNRTTWMEDCQAPFGKRTLRDNRAEVCTGDYCNTPELLPKIEPLTCLTEGDFAFGKSATCGLDMFGCIRFACNGTVNQITMAGCRDNSLSCVGLNQVCSSIAGSDSYTFSCKQCDSNNCNVADGTVTETNGSARNGGIEWIALFGIFILFVSFLQI